MVALQQVMILFFLIVIGYVIKKLKVISNDMNRDISNLVMNVALPAFIIKSMNFPFALDILNKSGKLLIISTCVYAFSIAFSFFVAKGMKARGTVRDIFQYAIVFANVGYMGYPITRALMGDMGVFYAAIYNLYFNILTWTLGVYFLTRNSKEEIEDGHNNRKITIKQFINPGLIAVCIGFILFLFSIELPYPISRTLELLGDLTTPLAMIFSGSMLADEKISGMFREKSIFTICTIRLLVLPASVMIILKLIGFSDYLLIIPVIITAMPVAANTAIMASKFNNNYYLASKIVFLSTFFSVFTIPLITMLIK